MFSVRTPLVTSVLNRAAVRNLTLKQKTYSSGVDGGWGEREGGRNISSVIKNERHEEVKDNREKVEIKEIKTR